MRRQVESERPPERGLGDEACFWWTLDEGQDFHESLGNLPYAYLQTVALNVRDVCQRQPPSVYVIIPLMRVQNLHQNLNEARSQVTRGVQMRVRQGCALETAVTESGTHLISYLLSQLQTSDYGVLSPRLMPQESYLTSFGTGLILPLRTKYPRMDTPSN